VTGWLRTYWPKVVSGLAIMAVAGVAGVVSYTHIYELTLALHQTVMVARLMPFGVDGLIVAGSVVLMQSVPGQRWLGWVGVGPGVVISLFANVESGIRYGWLSAAWAGVPAGSFFLATFILERWLSAQAGQPHAAPEPASPVVLPGTVPASAEDAARMALEASIAVGNALSQRQLSDRFGITRPAAAKVARSVAAASNGHAGEVS
jgi:hypothetical protein